ncbi:unnamed protein product [Prorocentrum cordatum]|uniref:Uncharacterized protein n=1 Tax=Prorocentrum cordatum TaxID=2364126 RepID=A0ABN9PDM6_9DINO|nr:unnamed protein product [Polarella glacialis]
MGLPPPEPIDPDGPEAAFYDGVTMSAARWTPRLHSPESGADCWMQWCQPYVRELLMQVQHDHWVQEARQGRSLDQMAEDICAEAWEDGAENRDEEILRFVTPEGGQTHGFDLDRPMEAAAQWFDAAEAELVKLHELGEARGYAGRSSGCQIQKVPMQAAWGQDLNQRCSAPTVPDPAAAASLERFLDRASEGTQPWKAQAFALVAAGRGETTPHEVMSQRTLFRRVSSGDEDHQDLQESLPPQLETAQQGSGHGILTELLEQALRESLQELARSTADAAGGGGGQSLDGIVRSVAAKVVDEARANLERNRARLLAQIATETDLLSRHHSNPMAKGRNARDGWQQEREHRPPPWTTTPPKQKADAPTQTEDLIPIMPASPECATSHKRRRDPPADAQQLGEFRNTLTATMESLEKQICCAADMKLGDNPINAWRYEYGVALYQMMHSRPPQARKALDAASEQCQALQGERAQSESFFEHCEELEDEQLFATAVSNPWDDGDEDLVEEDEDNNFAAGDHAIQRHHHHHQVSDQLNEEQDHSAQHLSLMRSTDVSKRALLAALQQSNLQMPHTMKTFQQAASTLRNDISHMRSEQQAEKSKISEIAA